MMFSFSTSNISIFLHERLWTESWLFNKLMISVLSYESLICFWFNSIKLCYFSWYSCLSRLICSSKSEFIYKIYWVRSLFFYFLLYSRIFFSILIIFYYFLNFYSGLIFSLWLSSRSLTGIVAINISVFDCCDFRGGSVSFTYSAIISDKGV